MPTLFEDWLKATQFKMPQQQAPSGIPDWANTATPSSAVVPEEKGASFLTRLMTTLQIPQQAITGAAAGAMDVEQERQSGNFSLSDLLRPFSGGITGAKNAADIALTGTGTEGEFVSPRALYEQYSSIKDRPETQGMTAEQLREYVKNVRDPEYQQQINNMSGWQRALRATGDFAANLGTDPLTYVGGEALKPLTAAFKPTKSIEEALAATDAILPNVPAGLDAGQAAAAVADIHPANLGIKSAEQVPVPNKLPEVPTPGFLTDRTLPEPSPRSATVEPAVEAAPGAVSEAAQAAAQVNNPLADVAARLEQNTSLPAGAAALADKVVPHPAQIAAQEAEHAAEVVKRDRVGAENYDPAVAQTENLQMAKDHEKAVDAAKAAENLKIWEEAQAEWSGSPKMDATSEAHADALHEYMGDLDGGMPREQANQLHGPEIAYHEYVANHLDEVNARMAAAVKTVPTPKFVGPEDVAARFVAPTAPVADKVAQGSKVVKSAKDSIATASSIGEAEIKGATTPAEVYSALSAGAAEAIPVSTRAVARALETTQAVSELPNPGYIGRAKPPDAYDVVTNMVLDKIGFKSPKIAETAIAGTSLRVKLEGVDHILDLNMMTKIVLSENKFLKYLAEQARRVSVRDAVTGVRAETRIPRGRADTDVLFTQPEISGAAKQKDTLNSWQRLFERKGEGVDKTLPSYKTSLRHQEALDNAAKETAKLEELESAITGSLKDTQLSARHLLAKVDEYEGVLETWEARLAAARKAKKSTRIIKFHMNRAKEYWARTQGTLTRAEAAKVYADSTNALVNAAKELEAQKKVVAKADDVARRIGDQLSDQITNELKKISEEPVPQSRGVKQIKDSEVIQIGRTSRTITFGDLKDAIRESANEYQSVINLTRQWEREGTVPGVEPVKPANVTPTLPNDAAPPVSVHPYENVRDPIVQSENTSVLSDLTYDDIPVHSIASSPKMAAKLEARMKDIIQRTDEDINTPYVRWGDNARYQRVGHDMFVKLAKAHGKPDRYYEDLYKGAGGGTAGAKALRDAGLEDVVSGGYTIEKQFNLATKLKTTFHYAGMNDKNSLATLANRTGKKVQGKPVGMTKSGVEDASRVAWETLLGTEESYLNRGAKFITNYYPKDPQKLSDMIRVAAQDTSSRLGYDVPPHMFMTLKGAHTAKALDNPELVDAINSFWDSIPFISRNFDGARNAVLARQWGKLSEMFPSIAKSQRFVADEFGVPTREFGYNSKVPEWSILAEPGAAIGIQKEMTQSAASKTEAIAKESEVASKAQEPVVEQHKALDEANGGNLNPPDDGGDLLGSGDYRPNPGHGKPNSNSQVFSWLKQKWQDEMGHNEILNLVRDRNSYGKYVSTEIQNWWDHNMKMYTKAEISQTLIKYRHDSSITTYTDKEQEIINKYDEWVDQYFRGPQSVFVRSGLTEHDILEFMPHGGGATEFKQIMDPEGYIAPTKVRGEAAIHLYEDAPQVMSNMQQALTRALAMKHYRGDVMAKWTSPVATGDRTAAIKLNGKTVYTTPEYAAQHAKYEGMLKEMLQYTPQGAKAIKELDGLQGIWKTMVTIARPGHHVRNSMGNSFMLIGGLTHSAHAGTYLKDAIGMMRDYGNYGAIIKSDRFAAKELNKSEFSELLATGKVTPQSKNLQPKVLFKVKGQEVTDQMVMSKIKEKGLYQGAEVSEDTERLASTTGGWNKKLMHAPYVRRMRQLSSLQEHAYRGAMFRGELEAFMRKGMSFEVAADKAAMKSRRFYPDGLTLSKVEKDVLRRVIPFYTYTRTIMGPLTEVLMTKPHLAAAPLRAQQTVGQYFGGDDMPNVPDYLGAAYPTGPTYMMGDSQIGIDVGSQHLDTYKLLTNPSQQLASMVSPFGAIPYALMTGADQNGTPLRTGQDKMNMLANNAPIFNSLFPAFTGHRVGSDVDGEYSKQLAWINFLTGTKQKELNTPKIEKAWEFQQRDAARP